MKSIMKPFFLLVLFLLTTTLLPAQLTGNKNLITKDYELSAFDMIDVGSAFTVKLNQSQTYYVSIETDENLFSNIEVKVKNGRLEIEARNIRKFSRLYAEIGLPDLNMLRVSGAASVNSDDVFEGETLRVETSGASDVDLQVKYNLIESELSGASKLELSGYATTHVSESSGASKLMAQSLQTDNTYITSSGASRAQVFANERLETKQSGAAKIQPVNEPEVWIQNDRSMGTKHTGSYRSSPYSDTTSIDIGNFKVEVVEGDTVKVNLGRHSIIVDEHGNVSLQRKRFHKFNGHWAGFELGFNGLLTPDFNMSYPKAASYLDLRMEKSINVNLNFYEQNIAFNKAGTFGMVSGLGLTWNNYRFRNNAFITPDSAVLRGYYMEDISARKSKITNLYLTIPLLFEVQSKAYRTRDKLHFSAGVVGGWRIRTHSKIYYDEANKEFSLRDPVSGDLLPVVMKSPGKSNRNIAKNYDSFHMRPFKLDAAVRAGWGIINLYANYSLTSLFIADRGPEVYPFSVGFVLTGW